MKKILKSEKGITLVALVITIIILLILAGISISALTNTGIFQKAKDAKQKSENAALDQNIKLDEYESELDKYLPEQGGIKLADKVKVGAYVSYKPDAIDSNALATLKTNLNTYSGKSDSTINSVIDRDNFNWRVLDVTKDGQVRLISATPTDKKIELYGYNGYNNAVKLLDDACSTLYNSKLASKVQNLKIGDIQEKMVEKNYVNISSYYGQSFTPINKYYPSILLKEKEQKVTIGQNITIGTELDFSEQKKLENQTEKTAADTLDVKNTYWYKEMAESDFSNSIYYNLFISNGSNYDTYWMSSRCASTHSGDASFDVRIISSGCVNVRGMYYSDGTQNPVGYAFRPVITLNSNVKVTAGDGSEKTPFEIK